MTNLGAIDEAEDVFFLHRDELSEAAEHPGLPWGSIVEERKQEWERWTTQLPPSFIGEGEIHMDPVRAQMQGLLDIGDPKDGEIPGLAASGGQVQGTARLILTLQDAHRFKPVNILVTYSTAPPWTPLFAIAAAVVTDSGGPLSHCAIVAREYEIPAVVGTKVATARIKDGTLLTVNGSEGVVTFEE